MSNVSAKVSSCRPKEKLVTKISAILYISWNQKFISYLFYDNVSVYCKDINRLMHNLGVIYVIPSNAKVYDYAKRKSIKVLFLRNGNKHVSLPTIPRKV